MKHRLHIFSFVLSLLFAVLFVFFTSPAWGAVTSTAPSNYYTSADGKTGNNLRLALESIISGHTDIGYDYLKYLMKYSDTKDADGTHVVDIYSDCEYTSGSTSLSWISSGNVGDGMNREHTVPQSWFGKKSPMVGDAFHIYPTDAKSNNNRSSYLYGEVDSTQTMTQYTGTSGGKTYHELGSKGTSKWSSSSKALKYTLNGKTYTTTAYYSGTIYEPDNEYKGDIARGYFYMATRYASGSDQENCSNWSGGAFGSDNNGMTNYTAQLMLKWHRQDPVSEKELLRNEVIYGNSTYNQGNKKQGNRNPFIDYPCLVEYIWGDSVGKAVDFSKLVSAYDASFSGQGCPCENSTDPAITSPSNSVNIGSTSAGVAITKNITIKGVNLTSGLNFALGGTNSSLFTISTHSMTQANATSGTAITVTYTPTAAGNHTATLTISGGGLSSNYVVTLTGTCCTPFTVNLYRNGILESVSSCGDYTLPTSEADACDGWEFKGWTTSSSYSSTTAPSYVTEVSSATTVYAVYGKSEGGGGTVVYEKVTSLSNITAGTYIIINNSKYLPSTTTSSSPTQGTAPTVTNNQIASSDVTSAMLWTFSGTSNSAMSITNASGKYLFVNGSGNSNLRVGDTSDTWAFSTNSTGFSMVDASQSRYCATYAAGSDWRTYTTNHANYGDGGIVYLYKQTGGGGTTTYKTTPCTTYKVFYADANGEAAHGSYWADQTTATAGTTIELEANPADGYELTGWTVTKYGTSTTVEVTNDEFTMPECSVTVAATFAALASHTVTFVNNGSTYTTRSGYAGQAISAVSDPTACTGYTFEGWSTSQYAVDNTGTPSLSTPTTIPAGNVTYYAVYSKTEGSGSSAATAGTTLWSEDFSGYSADNVPSGDITNSHTGTTVYGDSTITYACDNGGGTTKIYDANLAGGTSPEILIAKSNGSFSISNIPTGYAETMTLLFNTNKSSYPSNFSITSGTSGISIVSLSSPATNQLSCTIMNANSVETFDLTITYTYSQNGREDNFLLTVATAGSGGSTTYHTTAPDCCTRTITATTADDSMGTVGVTLP